MQLATQIVDASYKLAHARALSVTAVYGGVGLERQAKAAAKSHIIVATPGRLEDLLQRRAFSLKDLKVLVLDEADRMLDMGFRPAVDRVVAQCPRNRQTLFFSATLEGEAGRIAQEYTTDARTHVHKPAEEKAADITHRFVDVRADRVTMLVDELKGKRDLALVFVRTKRGADRLVKRLGTEGVKAVAMHGNKSQGQRERALASFEKFEVDVLVATDVAARGIHVDAVSHVINFDPPEDRETYVHRTGRTGRAGNTGTAITFVGSEQAGDVGKIARDLDLEAAWKDAGLRPARAGSAQQPQKRTGGSRNGGGGNGGGSGRGSRNGSSSRNGDSSGGGHRNTSANDKNDGRKPRTARSGDGDSARTVHSARPSGRGRGTRSPAGR